MKDVDDPSGRVDKAMDEMLKTKDVSNIIAHSLDHTSPTSSDLDYNNNNALFLNKGGRDKTLPQLTATSTLFQAHS